MRDTILTRLQEIESDHHVKIIQAIESGSRGWGFPSSDSDYDVRFIYLHRPDWYLSIDLERKGDVIEFPVDNELDITGWDLRKALQLLCKSNPPLLEWFSSPIVYQAIPQTRDQFRDLANHFFSPTACMHHYRRSAQGKWGQYSKSGKTRLKPFFYALRCLLAFKWVERGCGIVPMPFQQLVEELIDSPELRLRVDELVELKRNSRELDLSPIGAELEDYVVRELYQINSMELVEAKVSGQTEDLNVFFRSTLCALWPNS